MALTLSYASDTGVLGDGITKNNLITLTASGATVGNVIQFYDGATAIGLPAVAGVGGQATTVVTLLEGDHNLGATNVTAGGTSPALALTIDNTAPLVSIPDLAAASDTGLLSIDNITRTVTPTINGTAEAGATVTLYDTNGTTVLGTTVATGGNWSIVSSTLGEGVHALTARTTDVAGNVGVSLPLAVVIDTGAPVIGAPVLSSLSDSGTSAVDNLTNVSTPTLTGTAEADSTVTLYDTNGTTVLGTAVATNGNWSITSSSLSAGAHVLTTKAVDAAGNTSLVSGALTVTIDTAAPSAPSAPDLLAASDNGISATDNVTSLTTPTLTGTAEAGSTVTLYDTDGTTVLGAGVATGGAWSITSSALGAGVHTLTTVARDAAGNASAPSVALAVTIDTATPAATSAPDLAAASDTGASNTDNITSLTTPTLTGTAEAGSTVTLYDTDGTTVLGSAVAVGGAWSITSSTLAAGPHTLTTTARDLVGHVSAPSAALTVNIDTTAPSVPSAPDLVAASDNGVSSTDNITGITTPTLTGAADTGSTVTLYDTDGTTVLGSAVATGGAWSITSSALAGGPHVLTTVARDPAGNASAPSVALTVTIDSAAPAAPSAPDLVSASDTGASATDNITSLTTPTLTGTAEAGSTVTLYDTDGTTVLGSAVATGGAWSITSSALASGVHTLTTTARDLVGNVSSPSAGLSVTVDGASPAAPSAPDLAAVSDTGASNTDNLTNLTTPTLTGTAEAGSTVTLYDTNGTTVLGTTVATGGAWSITSSALAAGSHTLTATARDPAGNASALSSSLAVTIDAAAPAAPSAPDLAAASDTGVSATDNITGLTTPTLTGTAEAGSTVTLYDTDGTTVLGTGVATGGAWSITSSALASGNHTLSATARDLAGNTSAASPSLTVAIDTAAPAAPSAPDLTAASDTGTSNTDNVTNLVTPTLTGTAEANSTVTLYDTDGTTVLGTGVATGGTWSIASSALSSGSHSLTATARDAAGATSVASSALVVNIDTAAPAAPSAPDLAAVSDTGASNTDNLTGLTTPTVTGTAEAGSAVTLYDTDGTTVLGTGIATGGAWSIASSALASGNHTLSATARDAAGNISAVSPSLTVTIDTTAPAAPSAPDLAAASDTGVSAIDNITSLTTPTLTGTAAADSLVTLYDTNGTTVLGSAIATGGAWSITSASLSAGAHALTTTARDAAGNISAPSASLTVTVDTSTPSTPSAPDLVAGSDDGVSSTDNITSITAPTFAGTAGTGSIVTLYDTDGTTVLGSTTAVGGAWTIASATLAPGAHALTATASNAAGAVSAASAPLTVTIDTAGSTAPSAPDLAAASDTGVSSTDNITSLATPTLTGTAPTGALVTLYDTDGTTVLGTATAAGGVWSITSSALGGGSHALTAIATDTFGVVSAPSGPLVVTIDTAAPAAPPAPDLVAASDTGASATDNITSLTTPTLAGTAEAGSTVTLYDTDGTTVLGSAVATGGAWTITSSALAAGPHTLTTTARDAAGNTSVASASLAVTIDTAAPAAPSAPDLAAASDTGASNTDNITSLTTPTLTGTAEAGSTVTLYDTDGTTVLGTTVATGGAWSITSSALAGGDHTLTATARDVAGAASVASPGLTITISTTTPAASAAPDLSASSDTGVSNSDNVTNVATPTLAGTAATGSTVTLYDTDGTTVLGSAVAVGGNWSITSSTLGAGAHTLTTVVRDPAGAASAPSAGLTVNIDTSAPATPSAPDLAAASDTGTSATDDITTIATPTLTGTAEAGSTVTLYDTNGTTVLGSALATGGAWSISSAALSEGVHSLSARATDTAGNSTAASAPLSVTVDLTAPAVSAPDLAAGSDDGLSNTDNVTSIATPTFTGTAETGASVQLREGGVVLGATTAAGGTWSIVSPALSAGAHLLTAVALDVAGNSATSAGLDVVIGAASAGPSGGGAPPSPPVSVIPTGGDDNLSGTTGDDTMAGGGGADSLTGGSGADTVDGDTGNDTLAGDTGGDNLRGLDDDDMVRGGAGDDTVNGNRGADNVFGDDGNDQVYGGQDLDNVGGGGGDDTVNGNRGNDHVFGDDGNDLVYGGQDSDDVHGGTGDDTVSGDLGDDIAFGDDGNDQVYGGQGSDLVDGGAGADTLNGNMGADTVQGGLGADLAYGGQDADSLDGGAGGDCINGNRGEDTVRGGSGDDSVYGGRDNDSVYGDDGNDHVFGDLGDDELFGGAGADTFVFSPNSGLDWINDFNFLEGDRIQLSPGTAYAVGSYQGQVILDFGGGNVVGLSGIANFSPDFVTFV